VNRTAGHESPPTLDVFETTFNPSRADYVALVRNAPLTPLVVASGWLMLLLCAVLLAMGFLLVTADGEPAASPELSIASIVLIPMGISMVCWARTAAFLAWRQPMNREPVTALVNADGIGHSGPSGQQFLSWSAAARARETADAIYVYVPHGLATLVYWLPKSAVRAEDLAGLRSLIRSKVPRYRAR
jgi:hypothetical protein